MRFSTFQKDVNAVLDTYNDEQLNEVESIIGPIYIDTYVDQLYQIFEQNKLKNVKKFIQDTFENVIQNKCSVTDAALAISQQPKEMSTVETYFNNVKQVYKRNGTFDVSKIDHSETDPTKMIENNLRTVVSIAKRYTKYHLTMDELISAGNEGLCKAVYKYTEKKWKLRNELVADINTIQKDKIGSSVVLSVVDKHIKYGDIKEQVVAHINSKKIWKKQDIIDYFMETIPPAKFNSVAAMWIRAAIIDELGKRSSIVKTPDNSYASIIELDAPVSKNSDTPISAIIDIETQESKTDAMVNAEMDNVLDKLFWSVPLRDRGIVLKKFGVNMPAAMEPKEIAKQEGISVARVSQIFAATIERMKQNMVHFDISANIKDLLAVISA